MATGNLAKEVFLTPPLSIAGCATWLDAADITTMFQNTTATTPVTADGQTIGAWKDKSSNSYFFIQGTTANQPTYKSSILNGASITRWNGSSTGLQSSTTLPFYTSASSGGSFFFVFMVTNNSSQQFLMTYQNQTSGTFCVSESEIGCPTGNVDTGNFGIHQGCSKANVALNQITTNTYVMMNLNLLSSGTAPANTTIFKNGTSSSMTAQNGGFYSGTSYPNTNNARYLNIGYRVPFGIFPIDCWLAGDIAEVIWFQNPLTTTQQQQVEGYLSWKWGLQSSLPASHPYAYSYQYQTITRTVPLKATSSSYFFPTAISGCQLWMDATDSTTITRSGANITQWNDKANLYTGTATNNPQYNSSPINGLPTIHFDGASSRYVLLTANNFNYSFMTYFMVIRWVSGSGGFMGTDTPGNYGRALAVSSPNVQLLVYSQFYTTTVQLTANQPCILSAYFNGTTDLTVILNGVKTLFSVAQGAGNTNTNGFNIGVFNPSNGGNHSFDMGEGIVYNSILSDAQRQQIEGYLAWKWGLTSSLQQPHPNSTTAYVPFPFPTAIPKASSRMWSVLNPAGCAVWLDAFQETGGNGSAVTLIADRSGNGINMTASATLSTNYLNRNPVYNLGTNVPRNSSFTWNTYFTQFVVVKGNNPTGGWLVNIMDGTNNYINYIYTGNWTLMATGGFNDSVIPQGTSVLTSTPGGVTAWAIFSIGYGGGTTAANYSINGTVRSTTTAAPSASVNQTGTFYISGNYYGSYDTYTYFAEFMHYNSVLTDKQRQQVEGYLAWKWGLQSSLPGGHPYINFPPSP